MTELKPCPFCGGKGKVELVDKIDDLDVYMVECQKCGAAASFGTDGEIITKEETIDAWNRRVGDDKRY